MYPANAHALDIDGDGIDEVVAQTRPGVHAARPGLESLVILDAIGRYIEQVNIYARLLPPLPLDLDGDGTQEIAVPFIRVDSLFVSAIDIHGSHLFTFFLARGQAREEPTGNIPWDPTVAAFYAQDVDGDGKRDLVSVITTGYARSPRGVYVHRIPDGRLVGQLLIGAGIVRAHLTDFDGDGYGEVLLECPATHNGASAGGFDDAHAYAIVVSLRGQPAVRFQRELGAPASTTVVFRRGAGSGPPQLVMVASRQPPDGHATEIEVVDPITWTTDRRLVLPSHFRLAVAGEFDSRAGQEIAVGSARGEVIILDGDLRELSRRRTDLRAPAGVLGVPDLDSDGFDEIVAFTQSPWRLLGSDGRTKAIFPEGPFQRFDDGQLRHRRTDGQGGVELLVRSSDGSTTFALALVPNRWYMAYRYGVPGAAALLAFGLPALGVGLTGLYRRNRRLHAVQTLALDSAPFGFVLLRSTGRIEWLNGTLRTWLDVPAAARLNAPAATLFPAHGDLVGFCGELLAADVARPRERLAQLSIRGREQPVRLMAMPFTHQGGRADWLIRVVDATEEVTDVEWRTWALLAQRVAHDLKNPLTSILLTLQRMRVEYRKQGHAASGSLDEYSRRIEERIGHLRRMTANFMKLTRADDPDRRPVNLGEFLESQRSTLSAGLPPDIELEIILQADVQATLLVDPEQLASVLENLVANSVNALPEGGAITVSAGTVRGIHLAGNGAGDFALLEVADTGVGIPRELHQRIFDPGFSTSRHGSGLGLPIVRKIVSDHGGDVAIESHPGSGTVVSVYLPLFGEPRNESGPEAGIPDVD